MIDVHIVDDHKILAEGLRRIINETGVANVSVLYYDLNSCRQGLTFFHPDVLLLDVELPDGNGVDFLAEIKTLYPDLKIMMLTSFSDISIAKRSLYNGALGYMLKNATIDEVMKGIETVNNGKTFLCENTNQLIEKQKNDKVLWLTVRERDLLELITKGCADPEIAEKLYLSQQTIKTYRKALLKKFNAKNSVALVQIAKEQKLI
jgi:DNA-binding NarL/FixJ family response regulator